MRKVVISHRVMEEGLTELKKVCRVVMPESSAFDDARLMEELKDADALLAAGAVTEEMLAGAPNLKIISNHGAGYDRVDVAAATCRKIPVTNIPDATAVPTAEMALMLLLCLQRNVLGIDKKLHSEAPERSFGMSREQMGHSLVGQTLGCVGMGHIGKVMASLCTLLGMKVIYYARHKAEDVPYEYVTLDELMERADVVSLHCPLTPETRGLIGAHELSLMKPTAVLINTARGAVVDNDTLIETLKSRRIAGAGLDVFPEEPHIPAGYLELDNVVLMPHYGTNTFEARTGMVKACCDRILIALDGKRPPNVVNPEIYEA